MIYNNRKNALDNVKGNRWITTFIYSVTVNKHACGKFRTNYDYELGYEHGVAQLGWL